MTLQLATESQKRALRKHSREQGYPVATHELAVILPTDLAEVCDMCKWIDEQSGCFGPAPQIGRQNGAALISFDDQNTALMFKMRWF